MIQFSKNPTSEIFGLSVWYGYKSMAQSCFKDGGRHYRFRILNDTKILHEGKGSQQLLSST